MIQHSDTTAGKNNWLGDYIKNIAYREHTTLGYKVQASEIVVSLYVYCATHVRLGTSSVPNNDTEFVFAKRSYMVS